MPKLFKLFYKYYLTDRPEKSPAKQNEFPMYIEKFDFVKYRKDIFAFKDQFCIDVAKTIKYKNEVFEIFRIETKNNQAKKKLLVIATVHGNEFATALVIPKFLSDISLNSNFYKEWQIRIIAPANPVGLKYQSRYNKNGYDINRDFKFFNTDEAKLQKSEIDIFKPDIIVSLHEHPHNGFMVFCTDKVPKYLQINILKKLNDNDIPLVGKPFYIKMPKSKNGITQLGVLLKTFMFVFGIHSLGRYTRKMNIIDITTESYWNEKDIKKRIIPHILTLQTVIKDFQKNK